MKELENSYTRLVGPSAKMGAVMYTEKVVRGV